MTNHVFYYLDPASIDEYIKQEQFQKCIQLYRQGIYSREELKIPFGHFYGTPESLNYLSKFPFLVQDRRKRTHMVIITADQLLQGLSA